MKVNIVIADDHDFFRKGLALVLSQHPNFNVIAHAINGVQLVEFVKLHQPDLVITDITMPQMNGIEATKCIHAAFPEIKIIALTMHDDDSTILNMLKAGALGYLDKNTNKEQLFQTIEHVCTYNEMYFPDDESKDRFISIMNTLLSGEKGQLFSERELEIISLIVKEKTIKEIASDLKISPRTVEAHRARIMKKIHVKSVSGILSYVYTHNLLKQ